MVELGVVLIGRCTAPLLHLPGGPEVDDRPQAERFEHVVVVACEPVEPVGTEDRTAANDEAVLRRQPAEVAEVVHLLEREGGGDRGGHGCRR